MRKLLIFVVAAAVGIGVANAAVRDASSINRKTSSASTQTNTTRSATTATSARNGKVTTRPTTTTPRSATQGTVSATRTTRAAATKSTAIGRSATTRGAIARPSNTATVSRAARAPARAATTSNTFGSGYNVCRDAYFTCMDQFCSKQNDTYRRCVCSSRLSEIQSRERTLSHTSDQLQDFKDLNIDVIQKTSNEVKAMLNATSGEKVATTSKDTSDSAAKLAGISEVLSNTKSKALSTQNTLDIAGNINSIWATTDLTSGVQIANLTGTALYNAVHSQCADLIADKCASTATLNMVVSAYGMYIENDCAALSNALDKKFIAANAAIRETETEMHSARLENYDAHNSTSINECIAQVRRDITANTACGENYVHCLDISGKYLNRDTGEPIYTADFYQLESSISLSGDILNNQVNKILVAELNRKRSFAARGLDTCRDLADVVWDEFMRQAITEIYQGQQERIRKVKSECLEAVNTCYDTQSQSLKDFSTVKEQLLSASRLETAEEMCQEKLYACANLYGGDTSGLKELVQAMSKITDQKIAQSCQASLQDYAKELCAIPNNDSLHSYPFGCRTYSPGSMNDATFCAEQQSTATPYTTETVPTIQDASEDINCSVKQGITYTSCNKDYFLGNKDQLGVTPDPENGSDCIRCEIYSNQNKTHCTCAGGTASPVCEGLIIRSECGEYENSLYKKMLRYAKTTCVRPSESASLLPTNILQDINVVLDAIRIEMARVLSKECERLGGIWIDTQHDETSTTNTKDTTGEGGTRGDDQSSDDIYDKKTHPKRERFYRETSASTKWGYCAEPNSYDNTSSEGDGNSST